MLREVPELQGGGPGLTSGHRYVMSALIRILRRMGGRMQRLRKASSNGPAAYGNRGANIFAMEHRLNPDSSHGESTHIILRLVDNITTLLVVIEGPLINQIVST